MVTVAEFNRAQREKSGQQQNVYRQAADTMREAGIRGLSGRTIVGTDKSGEKGSTARDIQRDFLYDKSSPGGETTPAEDMIDDIDFLSSRRGDIGAGNILETKGDPSKQSEPPKKTGIFGIDFSNVGLPTINPVLGVIQGFQNTNQVLEKLSLGSELNSNDKITLINLVNNLGGVGNASDNLKKLINEYAKSKEERNTIINNFNENFKGIKNLVKDQQDDLQSYFDRIDKMDLGDTIKTMAGDLTGTRDTKDITTLEDLTKPADEGGLGTEGLQFLKVTDPKTYYRLRPNDPDLANVSLQGLSNSPEDRQFAARIMEARALAADKQSRADANMGQGIMAASPALPGLPFEPPSQPIDMKKPIPPVVPPVPMGTGITPFDVRQFYATLPQYTQQGIMNPNLAQFYQNLGMFPGMNV